MIGIPMILLILKWPQWLRQREEEGMEGKVKGDDCRGEGAEGNDRVKEGGGERASGRGLRNEFSSNELGT